MDADNANNYDEAFNLYTEAISKLMHGERERAVPLQLVFVCAADLVSRYRCCCCVQS